jgi:hypothetical protein
METAKYIIMILILASLTTGTVISEESKISDTLTASCLVKITSDPAILPLDDTTVDYLLHSSGVGGKAARDKLGIQLSEEALENAIKIECLADEAGIIPSRPSGLGNPPSEQESASEFENKFRRSIGNEYLPFGSELKPPRSTGRRMNREPISIAPEQMILLRLSVNLQEDNIGMTVKPAAEEFMNAVIENLRDALRGAFDEYRNRVHGRLELAEEEASRTERELSDIQERLRKIADSHILDKDRILGDIMDLRRNLQNIKMNQESDRVIVESITKRIAETQARAKEQIANDTVLKEIQQIIERQQQQVTAAKLLADRGMAGEDKIVEAEQNLSRARIELAQRKEELSRSAGGNEIESLNRQLADRSIQESQNQARIAALNKQLAEQEDLLNKTDDYELLSLKTDIAKQNLQEALIWRDRISRQMRLIQPPMVSVLGGE